MGNENNQHHGDWPYTPMQFDMLRFLWGEAHEVYEAPAKPAKKESHLKLVWDRDAQHE